MSTPGEESDGRYVGEGDGGGSWYNFYTGEVSNTRPSGNDTYQWTRLPGVSDNPDAAGHVHTGSPTHPAAYRDVQEILGRSPTSQQEMLYWANMDSSTRLQQLSLMPEAIRRGINPLDYGNTLVDPGSLSGSNRDWYDEWAIINPNEPFYSGHQQLLEWGQGAYSLDVYRAINRGLIVEQNGMTVVTPEAIRLYGEDNLWFSGNTAGQVILTPVGSNVRTGRSSSNPEGVDGWGEASDGWAAQGYQGFFTKGEKPSFGFIDALNIVGTVAAGVVAPWHMLGATALGTGMQAAQGNSDDWQDWGTNIGIQAASTYVGGQAGGGAVGQAGAQGAVAYGGHRLTGASNSDAFSEAAWAAGGSLAGSAFGAAASGLGASPGWAGAAEAYSRATLTHTSRMAWDSDYANRFAESGQSSTGFWAQTFINTAAGYYSGNQAAANFEAASDLDGQGRWPTDRPMPRDPSHRPLWREPIIRPGSNLDRAVNYSDGLPWHQRAAIGLTGYPKPPEPQPERSLNDFFFVPTGGLPPNFFDPPDPVGPQAEGHEGSRFEVAGGVEERIFA